MGENLSFVVRIETLGCRLNQTESEGLAFLFRECGFPIFQPNTKTKDSEKKEWQNDSTFLCTLNTCTVTGKAEQKARHLIRSLLKTHKKAVILVTGCYAEMEREKIEKIDERVVAFSGKSKDALSLLPRFIKDNLNNIKSPPNIDVEKTKACILSFRERYENRFKRMTAKSLAPTTKFLPLFALSAPTFTFHSRATLQVQDGCNNACAFCRIRLARGKSISLPIEEATKRLRRIEEAGAAEVVITGVNLSQYDSDGCNFATLLETLLKKSKSIHIRISSLYPESVNSELLAVISDRRVAPHFHLSIQSGSNYILEKMSRLYKRDDIYKAVENLKFAKENPFIGCDIIAGFPEERDEHFDETYSMCKDLEFAGIHAFPFSPRPGTKAFDMKGKVSERIACQRVALLTELAKTNYEKYLSKCEGKRFFAVVESKNSGKYFVMTENYLHLPLKTEKQHRAGDGINVKIVEKCAFEV